MPVLRPLTFRAATAVLSALAFVGAVAHAQGGGVSRPAAAPAGAAAGTERAASARLALVIGNAAYKDSGALANPVNDARAMADALREAGFQVMLHTDLDQRRMTQAVREFGDALRKSGGVGLFYFAGHGVQIKGRNYLVPIGADIQREDEVAYAAVDAQAVLDKMEAAGNGTNVLILDACRNNPFARSFRSGSAGLAQMDAPVGTLVAFATAPGMVASDGTGSNGLYTQNLLQAMRKPGLKIEEVFKQVRVAVRRDSGGKQVPWESTSLEGDLFFTTAALAAAPAPAAAPTTAATIAAPAAASIAAPAAAPTAAPIVASAVALTAAPAPAAPSTVQPASTSVPPSRPESAEAAFPEPPPRLALAQPAMPATPAARAASTAPAVGDEWSYQAIDLWRNAVQGRFTVRVASVEADGGIVTTNGSRYDPLMRALRLDVQGDWREYAPHQPRGWEDWHPGRKTALRFTETLNTRAGSLRWRCEHEATVRHVRVEDIRVPAGEFSARRYEIEGTCQQSIPGANPSYYTWKQTWWYAPELRYYVAFEIESRLANGKLDMRRREELTSFSVHDAAIAAR